MHPYGSEVSAFSGVMPFGWYAVYTRHQHEKSAAQQLSGKGLNVLLPLYRSLNRWKDRTQAVSLPLFPNYLFVQADLQNKLEVLRTPGVCYLVCNAGLPVRLVSAEIEGVRRMTEAPCDLQPHPFLHRGDRVRVIRGPLVGLEGILVRIKNQSRMVLSLELLQKSASVEVDVSCLERISSASKFHSLHEMTEY